MNFKKTVKKTIENLKIKESVENWKEKSAKIITAAFFKVVKEWENYIYLHIFTNREFKSDI